MAKYRVEFTTIASVSVDVEVDDDDLDEYEAKEAAIEAGYENLPGGVCAQCSGWGKNFSLDFGEFDIAKESVVVERDAEGKAVRWEEQEIEPKLLEDGD